MTPLHFPKEAFVYACISAAPARQPKNGSPSHGWIRKCGQEMSSVLLKGALDAQIAASEHIRACNRCRHFFEIAYDETGASGSTDFSDRVCGPNPFHVTVQIMRELRSCPDWPKGI